MGWNGRFTLEVRKKWFASPFRVYYLNAYKDAYVQYNRDKIIKHAYAAGIRPELLGGVAWIESGGMPENYKFQIYETKEWSDC